MTLIMVDSAREAWHALARPRPVSVFTLVYSCDFLLCLFFETHHRKNWLASFRNSPDNYTELTRPFITSPLSSSMNGTNYSHERCFPLIGYPFFWLPK